jgi:hypothetical protein
MPLSKKMGSPCARAGILALALAGFPGCSMSPNIAMKVTTADGVEIEVPLNTLPEPATDGVVTLEPIHIAPWNLDENGKAKTLTYTFLVQFKQGYKPADVLIEDVTEDPILEIFHDKDPATHLSKLNFWGGVSAPFAPPDEHVKWILTLDNSVRVYRFTIRTTDGASHVLRAPLVVSMRMKSSVQAHLEMN